MSTGQWPETERRPAPSAGGESVETQKWWVLVAVGAGTFMSALDTGVVNTVLPVLTQAFQTDVATIEWVVTVYLLVVSGVLLVFGRLGDLYGHKVTYLSGFALFSLGSVLCGLSTTAGMLIGFRAIQALGAAMLFANGPAILTKTFPSSQRGQALGLASMMTYLGLTTGPGFGGWLASLVGWHAVFFINLPIGLVAILVGYRFVPHDRPTRQVEHFDILGAFVFLCGLIALLLGLNQGHAWGWASPQLIGSLVLAAVLLSLFVAIERRVPSPMLDLSLFRSHLFTFSTISAVLNYIGVYSVLFLLPFYLIQGRGFSAAQAGLILTAQPLVMAIAAPLSGTLSDRIGSRLPATIGMALLGAGLFLLSRLDSVSTIGSIIVALVIAGIGTGTFSTPNNSAMLGAAPRERQGIASGVLATARYVGMVLGVGLAGAIFTTVLGPGEIAANVPMIFAATSAGFLLASALSFVGALTSALR